MLSCCPVCAFLNISAVQLTVVINVLCQQFVSVFFIDWNVLATLVISSIVLSHSLAKEEINVCTPLHLREVHSSIA